MGNNNFSSKDDFILNYRPQIEFVEPEQVPEEALPEKESIGTSLDSTRDRTQKIIDGLRQIATLSDAVQKRIDQKVQSSVGQATGGSEKGLSVKLDPQKDFAAIAALKRRYPDRGDYSSITYDDYRKALDCMQMASQAPLTISPNDILAAQSNPLKTDFGGYSNQNGQNRAEISSSANSIQPINLEEFQKDSIISLFSLLRPLVVEEILKQISKVVGF
jgi:hypothetical protein